MVAARSTGLSDEISNPLEKRLNRLGSSSSVRFQRSVYDKASGATRPLDSRIATLGFGYNLALRMDEPDRLENPLGFQVTSYRVDTDYAPLPPMQHPAADVDATATTTGRGDGVPALDGRMDPLPEGASTP